MGKKEIVGLHPMQKLRVVLNTKEKLVTIVESMQSHTTTTKLCCRFGSLGNRLLQNSKTSSYTLSCTVATATLTEEREYSIEYYPMSQKLVGEELSIVQKTNLETVINQNK